MDNITEGVMFNYSENIGFSNSWIVKLHKRLKNDICRGEKVRLQTLKNAYRKSQMLQDLTICAILQQKVE